MVSSILSKLNCFNDPNFKFDPRYHRYTYGGKQYTSVTKFIANFHKPFEEDYWSKTKAEEAGVPQEWILKDWKDKNDRANFVGHATHEWIENYFKQIPQWVPNDLDIVDRINKFNIIFGKQLHKLTPVKFELRIFSKKYPLAGTIDSIFLYKGKLFILDWKTNGRFTHDSHDRGRFQKLLYPFDSYWKNHLNEYSIQVGMYALILEEWGFDIRGAYLVHIGPDSEAEIYKAEDMTGILRNYLPTHTF
jgi:ATP-dependent exoDNAse (exonuclease V) beta subunit